MWEMVLEMKIQTWGGYFWFISIGGNGTFSCLKGRESSSSPIQVNGEKKQETYCILEK